MVTPANEQERAQVGALAQAVQEATGQSVELAYVDQGSTGAVSAEAAREKGIELHVVRFPEAKKGFVLLPRRWVTAGFASRGALWPGRPASAALPETYERLPEMLAGLHYSVFALLMLTKAAHSLQSA